MNWDADLDKPYEDMMEENERRQNEIYEHGFSDYLPELLGFRYFINEAGTVIDWDGHEVKNIAMIVKNAFENYHPVQFGTGDMEF